MASNAESIPTSSRFSPTNGGTNTDAKCCEFCKAKADGRNLILCIDGTSNQFGDYNTNVIELYSRIIKDDDNFPQLTYYNSGIGTYARPSWRSYTYLKQILDNKIDLGIAWNFEKVVLAGYRWLSDNYVNGDKIFLFGFSRGAYQVRVLAGMIDKVGLILRGNEEQIPFAYELYADLSPQDESRPKNVSQLKDKLRGDDSHPNDNKSPNKDDLQTGESSHKEDKGSIKTDNNSREKGESSRKKEVESREKNQLLPKEGSSPKDGDALKKENQPGEAVDLRTKSQKKADKASKMATRFKETFSRRDVKVHFIGVWDTVSSVGVIRGKSLSGTNDFDRNNICYFRHALALDERRVKFLPEYVCGGKSYEERDKKDNATPRVKEVWFAGCHSDIGGGSKKNTELNNAAVPVLWMGNEALFGGLKLEPSRVEWKWEELKKTEPTESLRHIWNLFEFLPFKRLSYNKPGNTWWPHVWKGRVIMPGQKIHASVSFIEKMYKPKAKFSLEMGKKDWDSIIDKGKQNDVSWTKKIENLLELDLFDYSNVKRIIEGGNLDRLVFIALTREGCQAISSADPEFTFLHDMLKDSDKGKVAGTAILSKLVTHYDILSKMNQKEIVEILASVIEGDDQRADEAIKILYEFVRHNDGREAFLKMINKESIITKLLECKIWQLLIISELFTDDTAKQIIDRNPKRRVVDNFQLFTPMKQFSAELFGDENNADACCRLVEHGFFQRASANDAIQFLIGIIGTQTFALDVLSALLKYPEVQKEIPENFRDRWVDSLQNMIQGSNINEQYSGLQALSIFARYREMRKKILEAGVTPDLVKLFQSDNDAVKYCASRALIALDGDDPQPSIDAKDIIFWLVGSVRMRWRYRQTVKCLSEIVNNRQKDLMRGTKDIRNLDMLTQLPDSISSAKTLIRPEEFEEQEERRIREERERVRREERERRWERRREV